MNERPENKSKYFWGMFLPVIILYIVQNAVDIFFMNITLVNDLSNYKSGSFTDFIDNYITNSTSGLTMELIYVFYALFASLWLGIIYFKDYRNKYAGLNPFKGIADNVPMMIIGIVLLVVGLEFVVNFFVSVMATAFPTWVTEYQELMDSAGMGDSTTPLMALYACVLGPICEELCFRGICFKSARKIMPASFAIVVQALLFGGYHLNKLQCAYAFLIGLVFGYVMYRYNNILVTIVLHILYNSVGLIFSDYLEVSSDSPVNFFATVLLSLIVTYFGLWLLKKASPGVKIEIGSSDK